MRKCQNKSSSKQPRQHQDGEQIKQDALYEPVGGGQGNEAEYEMMDHEQKEVVLKDNPAYATHSHL